MRPASSSTSGREREAAAHGGGAPSPVKVSVRLHSATARSIAAMRRGVSAPHLGRGAAGKPVGHQPRGRQDVAQIVIDLGDGGAERGEPLLLAQGLAHRLLHRRQLALGQADLVARGSGTMTREASSGSSRNAIMLAVRRRSGVTSSQRRLT